MLHNIIKRKKNEWINTDECTIKDLIKYIRHTGQMRDAQIEAIEIYLYLKVKCGNASLAYLFTHGMLSDHIDLSKLPLTKNARNIFESNCSARALFEFTLQKDEKTGKPVYELLEKEIADKADEIEYNTVINNLFYKVPYTDYLFSLPMGAGKTFLMAAFIYLDLYFALNEPDNKVFAHNFIILAPSGLKSSVIPSLSTIKRFDPSWVLPEPSASNIKNMIEFVVLDELKTSSKSNRIKNPNVQKIAIHQPFDRLKGLVMITNAEKVILDRVNDTYGQVEINRTEDEKDKQANELRNLIGKIPNLSIFIDEVHHAATDDIKLRKVVNKWNENGTITGVVGFSGTPYLSMPDKIDITNDFSIKNQQISNVVYYYPLISGIDNFLKKPKVKIAENMDNLDIVELGVKDFFANYKETIYSNGTEAKLAIYCSRITRLEEEIYPKVCSIVAEIGYNPSEVILKYHGGNKEYPAIVETQAEFYRLDTPISRKRVILLAQIGKEGWDCRSLTGIILAQKGDCPNNMVLQTSCRCLRQVSKGQKETAVIWLNEENSKILDKQLNDEQRTSIDEINNYNIRPKTEIERYSRMEKLALPPVVYYQMSIVQSIVMTEDDANTRHKLKSIDLDDHRTLASIDTTEFDLVLRDKKFILEYGYKVINFSLWLSNISKESFGYISIKDLLKYEDILLDIYKKLIFSKDGKECLNEAYEQQNIRQAVRNAFHRKRDIRMVEKIIPEQASLLVIENLTQILVDNAEYIYPSDDDVKAILDADKGRAASEKEAELKALLESLGKSDLLDGFMNKKSYTSFTVENKDKTFHYIPYNFTQSRFELDMLKVVLALNNFKQYNLEVYYNGDNHVSNFKIKCYKKVNDSWVNAGEYTPDFLVIKRLDNEIKKMLIIETKGEGYANKPDFLNKRQYTEQCFIKMNNEKAGYDKFDYLCVVDNQRNIESKINDKIDSFFKED